jgi:cysteine-rich repeat protein
VGCGNGHLDPGEDCDDGNTANGDCCSSTCHFEANGSSCSDGNACTTGETCNAGTCGGGTAVTCNDNNGCTQDTCNPSTGCVYNPTPLNGTSCNDGNACTVGETCNAGTCGGGGPVVCNDGNACTADSCNPSSGCIFNPAPLNGASCSDGNVCTVNDTCSNGTCSGTPAPDADLDGTCNLADNCPYVPNANQADDGGVGSAIPDGIGDVCQCGDLTGDGIVDGSDVAAYRTYLANPLGAPLTGAAALKCSVVGANAAVCNIQDVAVMRRALIGLSPGIGQVCAAAVPH